MFERVFTFHMLKAVNSLTSFIKFMLCVFPIQTSKSINVEWGTCDRNAKQLFYWKQEKAWSFDKARHVKKDVGSEKYISTRFG